MLTVESKGAAIVARDLSGRFRWRAALVVEDEARAHPARIGGDGQGQAGPWSLGLETASLPGGLDRLAVRVRPAADRRLRRVYLRIAGGADGVPRLHAPRTRILSFRQGSLGEDGVAALAPGETVESFLAVMVWGGPGREALLFGSGGPAEDFARFRIDGDHLTAGFEPERIPAGEVVHALVFGAGEALAVLDAYGKHLAGFARPTAPALTGWNSWDYYGGALSMEDVRREMAAINASPLKGKLGHLVLDMGWEQLWGEWSPNSRFPRKPRKIAAEIEAAGFVPGIWLAPLQAHVYSQLGRYRQDLFVPGESGSPVVVDRHALLDFTLPDVQEHLVRLCGRLREAGFRLFKIDYIYQSYLDRMGQHSDRSRGKAGFVRCGLEAIRQAIGGDAHLLNCGGPVESALGLADSSRVTVDIHTFWGHVKFNARQLSARLWQNGRLWRIDPDFAIIRSRATTRDPYPNPVYHRRPLVEGQGHWMAGPEAAFEELRVWLTQVYLAAGNTFVSDSIARLNRRGLAALGRVLPPLPESARPLDLFQSSIPRFWLARGQRRHLLGVFNWEDREEELGAPPGVDLPDRGVDVWTGDKVRLRESLLLAPRSALLLRV
ncbi:MAG: hypothetical protein ABIL09_24795 [Gemmatimonadota bacterium]